MQLASKMDEAKFRMHLYLGCAPCRFYRACFKYGHCITRYWAQFKNITSNFVQCRSPSTSRRLLDDRQPRRYRLRVFPPYFHPFGPSPTLMCDANASTKGSQPFGDATCDESMRKRVFRFETSGGGRAGEEKKER